MKTGTHTQVPVPMTNSLLGVFQENVSLLTMSLDIVTGTIVTGTGT